MKTDVASDWMSKKLVTVGIEDSMRKAYQIMKEKKIRHLPITETGGDIIGVLSDRDVQRAMRPIRSPEGFVDEKVEFLEGFQAKDFMSWPIFAVDESEPIVNVVAIMEREKISSLLVRDRHGRVKGIVTTDDMMRLLQGLLEEDSSAPRKSIAEVFPHYTFGEGHWETKGECM